MDPISIALVAGTLAILAGVIYAVLRQKAADKQRIADFGLWAQEHGLRFEHRPATRGAGVSYRFVRPEDGTSLTINRAFSRKSGNTTTSSPGSVVYRAHQPVFQGGMVLYAPQLHESMARAASTLLGLFDNSLARMLLKRFVDEDIAQHLGELRDFPPPDGVALSILATIDPAQIFDTNAAAAALDAAPKGRKAESTTMIVVSDSGLQLRVPREILDPAVFEPLLALGDRLAADLPLRR